MNKRMAIVFVSFFTAAAGALSVGAQPLSQMKQASQSTQQLEIVAAITAQDFSGVVVTKDNRIFIGAPHEVDDYDFPTLAEYKEGRMVPYPSHELTMFGNPDLSKKLVSVHGMTLGQDGYIWLIDDGKQAGKPIVDGAPKVVAIDPATNSVVHWFLLPKGIWMPDSHLNDLRVDLTHGAKGTVFLTDSSMKQNPALLVLDIATGKFRRVLNATPFTMADERMVTYLEGQPHAYKREHPTMPQGGADGIELSPDSKKLYWTALNGYTLWSIPTAVLADPSKTDEQLEATILNEGGRPAADGITGDMAGNLYFGAYDQRSIVRRDPDGSFHVIAHDDRLGWPDALMIQNGYLYLTADQWNRMAALNGGTDLRKPPYYIVRIKLPNEKGGVE